MSSDSSQKLISHTHVRGYPMQKELLNLPGIMLKQESLILHPLYQACSCRLSALLRTWCQEQPSSSAAACMLLLSCPSDLRSNALLFMATSHKSFSRPCGPQFLALSMPCSNLASSLMLLVKLPPGMPGQGPHPREGLTPGAHRQSQSRRSGCCSLALSPPHQPHPAPELGTR